MLKKHSKKAAEIRGFVVQHSSLKDDKEGHWDYELSKNINNNFFKRKIDVKAMKKVNKSDQNRSDKMFLIELNNVGGGVGWAYAKGPDGFAFQIKDSFIIVSKENLQKKVEELIDINGKSVPSNSNKKPYIIYDRKKWNNHDRFVYIKISDLANIKNVIRWMI